MTEELISNSQCLGPQELYDKMFNISYYKDGTIPEPVKSLIYVFPSDKAGLHGKGASHLAIHKFGALRGKCSGFNTNSYAINVRDLYGDNTSDVELIINIVSGIQEFKQFVKKDQVGYSFFIADFRKEMPVESFKTIVHEFRKIKNCIFHEDYAQYLR